MVKTVLISGVFDLFHEGHAYLLKEISKHGEVFVLIDNDASVRARKGAGRPVNSETKRMMDVLDSGFVAKAVIKEQDSPLDIILRVKPDYIAVGDDYPLDKIVGLKEGAAWGCKPIVIPRIPGISTTNIIKHGK